MQKILTRTGSTSSRILYKWSSLKKISKSKNLFMVKLQTCVYKALSSVTRLGDLLDLGQLFKAFDKK